MTQPVLSIRTVLVTLGALSTLIAVVLAGFGSLGIERQLDARQRVIELEQALSNHISADTFMDDIRADVLRAVQSSGGANQEGKEAIRADLRHHADVVSTAIADNLTIPLPPKLHDRYVRIADLVAGFIPSGEHAVELALHSSAAGSANFESFRHDFSDLEQLMDGARDVLQAGVQQVRDGAAQTATRAEQTIFCSALVGVLLLVLITAVAVRIGQRITGDLAASREEAHHLALHDTLTGLPNRAFLAERLGKALDQTRRHASALAMLCLDLDRFKQVNDTLGHPVGDALLGAVADRLRGCLRPSDTVARLGGDEFTIIQFPLGSPEEATALAQRIVEALSRPYDLLGHQVVVGASVGIALAPRDASDAGHLLKMSDTALYRAKADGRGVVRIYRSGMDTQLPTRRRLDLRPTLDLDAFEVHYQPLIDLSSGRINAMEALVHWRHPGRGLIAPNDFIPLAEETGLIRSIGAWVLRQACADAATWPTGVRVAVNVSAAQFQGSGLLAAVSDALSRASLPPDRLELEVAETAFLADADVTLSLLRELRANGVRIAMDDFGAGNSSLGYLRSFPFDTIKIHRNFIRDIETSADCKAIVRAVTGLGTNLGISVAAEGVETTAQLDQIRAEGCDRAQGCLFGRPVPASDVSALFSQFLPMAISSPIRDVAA